jgi:hypothetical protein
MNLNLTGSKPPSNPFSAPNRQHIAVSASGMQREDEDDP